MEKQMETENRTISCKLGDAEEIIAEHDVSEDMLVLEQDGEHIITMAATYVDIPRLRVRLHEGTYSNYDEKSGEYEPDFSLTVIRSTDSTASDEYLYWEQDGLAISVANWLNSRRDRPYTTLDEVKDMDCTIVFAEG